MLFDTPDLGGDGTVYYTRHGGGRHGGVYQAVLDVATGELDGEPRLIWEGTGGIWPEGPHLYHLGEWYYLLISEGGTSYDHSLTVARSRSPWGPFEPCPHNPLITHRDLPGEPLQAVGHADLVDTPDGSWWMVMHGIRPLDRAHHIGRETLLAPVTWSDDGWPVVNAGEPLPLTVSADGLPARRPVVPRVDWIGLRRPCEGKWEVLDHGGFRLHGTAATLDEVAAPAFVARAARSTCRCARRS